MSTPSDKELAERLDNYEFLTDEANNVRKQSSARLRAYAEAERVTAVRSSWDGRWMESSEALAGEELATFLREPT